MTSSPSESTTNFRPNSHLFGRYTFADDSLGNAAYRIGDGLIRPDRTQVPVIGFTRVFSPTLISETRASFFKAYLARIPDGNSTPRTMSLNSASRT